MTYVEPNPDQDIIKTYRRGTDIIKIEYVTAWSACRSSADSASGRGCRPRRPMLPPVEQSAPYLNFL